MGEWVAWHRGYDTSPGHAGRLAAVQAMIRSALDRAPAGPIGVISLCAGDGRDLLQVLPVHPRRGDVRALLVDLEPELVARARARAARSGGAGVMAVVSDASITTAYAGAVPADVVLACGIFGNITGRDVRRTIQHLPELCAPGAAVIWTRGRFQPDLTPTVRRWFADAGFEELAFVTVPGTTAAAGAHRLVAAPRPFRSGVRLFTFLEKELRPSSRGGRAQRDQPAARPVDGEPATSS